MKLLISWLALLLIPLLSITENATAHEVRPAYLSITEVSQSLPSGHSDKSFEILWKQPIVNDKRLRLDPVFPESCITTLPPLDEVLPGALIRIWQISCPDTVIQSQPITIRGLSSTLTDAWVNVSFLNGTNFSSVLKPSSPGLIIGRTQGADLSAYLTLGIEHLLFGFDHILFVLGLMYFVQGARNLLKTVTAFTIAHSITLAGSSLELVHLAQAPVEAAIALSILYLAYEASKPDRSSTLSARSPWLVAFIFGLLHGFGFAGALSDIGLPDKTTILALLLFNIGVEIGQLIVLGAFLGFMYFFSRWMHKFPSWLIQSPLYVMGALSSYWFLQRAMPIIGV